MSTDVQQEQEDKDLGWFMVFAGAIIVGIVAVAGIILCALTLHAVVEIFSWAWDLIG